MASIYADLTRTLPPDANAFDIKALLPNLKLKLSDTNRQWLIPFFGAGASLTGNSRTPVHFSFATIQRSDVEQICRNIDINEPISQRFVELALTVAQIIDSNVKAGPLESDASENSKRAPSSWELADSLARDLKIEPFETYATILQSISKLQPQLSSSVIELDVVKSVAQALDMHHSIPHLLTMASYSRRDVLIRFLRDRLAGVDAHTLIQTVFAAKAQSFVSSRNRPDSKLDKSDYLIITTNYDTLIEQQLKCAKVPFCVVTVDSNSRVHVDFEDLNTRPFLGDISDDEFSSLKSKYDPATRLASKTFKIGNKSHSLAVLYKIHGSPSTDITRNVESVVIADRDYVRFIQKNGRGNEMVPSFIGSRLLSSRVLFLGYSFADWNVRVLYEQFVTNRSFIRDNEDRDYILTRSFNKTDHMFYERFKDLSVLISDLDTFAGAII